MELSVRELFRQDESGWEGYISWIGLPHLTEVRTGDGALNPRVGEPLFLFPPNDDFVSGLRFLPEIDSTQHYCLLAVNLEEETLPAMPEGVTFLGYDVADETRTSSLLNCGPWKGRLAPITERLNRYGLLSFQDAQLAQQLLPEEWGEEEPHAFVNIWALYDVTKLHADFSLDETES